VYPVLAVNGPVLAVPPGARAPLHPPEAVHVVALVEVHVSMDAFPEATAFGDADNVAVGAGISATVTVAGAETPPGPVQMSVYPVLAVNGPVLAVPPGARAPLHPPEAVHVVALVEVHVKVELAPEATAVGVAASETDGGGYTVTAAMTGAVVPPGPVQVKENVAFAIRMPVLCVPLLASVPLQSPLAVHEAAWIELHVSMDVFPAGTAVGIAVNCALGAAFTVIATVEIWLVPPGPVQMSE